MFTRLHLIRFKAWQDTGELALRPVTLLLGTNSSGKSSLVQSLLLLKQTVQSPDRTIHLDLGGDEASDLFDFGGFDDVLHRQDGAPRRFSLAFSFAHPGPGRVAAGSFACSYGRSPAGGAVVEEMAMAAGGRRFRAVRRERGAYSVFVDDEARPRLKGGQYAPERSIALPADAIAALDKDGQLAEDLSLAIRRELEGIHYLGPLRRRPERAYAWSRSRPGEVGSDGRAAIDALLASVLLRGDGQPDVLEGVSRWLSRMRLADRLEVRQQGRSGRYELLVHRDGVASNLRDVGIGVSQVLPVLVLAHFAPAGSTIMLEEPEIHLHPLAQLVLAELFVEVSQRRQVQFIVETHSEHLFRRMQTLVAAQKAGREAVALYFVERNGGGAQLRDLALDDYGRVTVWPKDFFGDALGETREQARLMFERQQRTLR